MWAESLASHLGPIFGIDVQRVVIKSSSPELTKVLRGAVPDIPTDWKPIGTLARNIFPRGQEINYGASIVQELSKPLPLEEIERRIGQRYYAPEDLLQRFAQMIVFDALIGNMDRHHENWGIVETVKYKQLVLFDKKRLKEGRQFTPLYDHGSSLMFELDESIVRRYLKNEKEFIDVYVKGKPYSFVCLPDGKRANIFQVIEYHTGHRTDWGKRFIKEIKNLDGVSLLEIAKAIAKMPNTKHIDYTEDRKELLLRSILLRIDLLRSMV